MVLGISVPGRPTYLSKRRARAFCAFSRYGLGCLDVFFFSRLSFFLLLSLRDGPILTEILSQRAVTLKKTNQLYTITLR